jgi:hypothetical protein
LAGLDDVHAMPDTFRHDQAIARIHFNIIELLIFKDDVDPAAYQLKHFVSIGMHFTAMR